MAPRAKLDPEILSTVNPYQQRSQVQRYGARWHLCALCDGEYYCTYSEWKRHRTWCLWDHFINQT
jgi:hypothetical protein